MLIGDKSFYTMSSVDKLESISYEDLFSLIKTYEQANNPHPYTLDTLYSLRNYQKWLKAKTHRKHVFLDVLTLNNEWSSDGLCIFVVSLCFLIFDLKQVLILKMVNEMTKKCYIKIIQGLKKYFQ